MKLSVIMVAYNSETTVARSVRSFLEQDYADKELIVVDGASTDRTCDIIAEVADNAGMAGASISVVSEPDTGIYDGLNKGIGRATGGIIGLLHSNDVFASTGILSRVASAFEGCDLDAVYADVEFFPEHAPEKTTRRYRSGKFSPAQLGHGILPAHPTLFLKSDVFERFGRYDTSYKISGDFEFVARIFKDDSLAYRHFDEVWTRMQTGGASTSGIRSKVTLNVETLRACRTLGIKSNMAKLMVKYLRKLPEFLPAGWR
ncbi:MAG: glycosyltransferase [Roseicyclus sp.]|nr:glycosyltransferase [Roseicyclus sp.]